MPENRRNIRAILEEGTAITEALLKAAREALLVHKRLGLPLVVWRNGRIEWVAPEELERRAPDGAVVEP